MKKIMIIAVAAIALAACSRTFDTAPVQPKEIGFNTWTELLTKVRTQGSSAFAAGDDFAVYGFKDKSTPAPVTEFDDVVVSTTDGSVWTYSPKKIWDTSYDSYTFYAISPAAIGTDPDATVDPQTGEIESDDITFAGNDNDILVADKVTVAKTDGAEFFNGYGKVALVFNHITSKVDIVVKKSTNLDGLSVRIDEISLEKINSVYKFTVDDAYTSSHPVVDWETGFTASASNTDSFDNTEGVTPVASLPTLDDVTTQATVINSLIAMPQTFRTTGDYIQSLKISYTIIDGNGTVDTADDVEYEFADKVYPLTLFDSGENSMNSDSTDPGYADTPKTGWVAGKHITYTVTIDAHTIEFTASITDWTDEAGYLYVIN